MPFANLLAGPCGSIDETLSAALCLIPPGLQYPEMARARIILEGREFASGDFRETPWKLSADIVTIGKKLGSVEVCYLEERPALDEGPFLKEERALIDNLAKKFGGMIERKQAEEALRKKDEEVRGMTQQLWQTAKLATMGELAASIAHELNNPLATVGLRVELLQKQDPSR